MNTYICKIIVQIAAISLHAILVLRTAVLCRYHGLATMVVCQREFPHSLYEIPGFQQIYKEFCRPIFFLIQRPLILQRVFI